MPGYKHPCRYCNKLVLSEASVCPFCGKAGPLSPPRCPKCASPTEKGWKACSNCGFLLEVKCPHCGKITFLDYYCEHCSGKLAIASPK